MYMCVCVVPTVCLYVSAQSQHSHIDVWFCKSMSPLARYNDEVSPGNQLKHHNKRKLQVLYWSLKEFGSCALSNEYHWFCTEFAIDSDCTFPLCFLPCVYTYLLRTYFKHVASSAAPAVAVHVGPCISQYKQVVCTHIYTYIYICIYVCVTDAHCSTQRHLFTTLLLKLRFTMTAILSETVKMMPGGMSYVMDQFVKTFQQTGKDMTQGIVLNSGEGPIVLICRVDCMVADEAALKYAYACKGASGNLACMLCRNVVPHKSGSLHSLKHILVLVCRVMCMWLPHRVLHLLYSTPCNPHNDDSIAALGRCIALSTSINMFHPICRLLRRWIAATCSRQSCFYHTSKSCTFDDSVHIYVSIVLSGCCAVLAV